MEPGRVAEKTTIWRPTDANRDLGYFLVFLGVVGVLPVRYVLERQGISGVVPKAATVGLVLVVAGLMLLRFSRKRLVLEDRTVSVSEGLFRRSLRYSWEGVPSIRLASQEEERQGKAREYWLVSLVDGKRQYVLDRRSGGQLLSRSLAEALAKTIGCPVLERIDDEVYTMQREELDLPLVERIRRHPKLMGVEAERPENCSVQLEEKPGQLLFSWRLMNPALLTEILSVVFFLVLLGIAPVLPAEDSYEDYDGPSPGARLQQSFLDLARTEHDYTYFLVVGGFAGVTCLYLFGHSRRWLVTPEQVRGTHLMFGVPVLNRVMPAKELEEVLVRPSTRGTHLQFVSDRQIFSGRLSDDATATWVASKVRHFYGNC